MHRRALGTAAPMRTFAPLAALAADHRRRRGGGTVTETITSAYRTGR